MPTSTLAVTDGVKRCFINSGQSCIAPTRMLVHRAQSDDVIAAPGQTAATVMVGDPTRARTSMGPVAGTAQFAKVQGMIETGIAEGATLACGGPGRPEGLNRGYYVRPTIFADVTPEHDDCARGDLRSGAVDPAPMTDEDEAVAIANDTPYGLGGYVYSGDADRARRVGARIRAGRIFLNDALASASAPFGGYKQSGNGRELGEIGMREFFEVKAVLGYGPS